MQNEFLEAVKSGDSAAVLRMLDADPSLATTRDDNGVSALLIAVYNGKKEIVDILLARDIALDIFEASATGSSDRVATLLDADPSLLNAFAPDGFFPLALASFFGHPDVVNLLLSRGADVNAQARNGMRIYAIHAAAANRNRDISLAIIKALLAHGADPNVQQHGGWTPLHQAGMHGHGELVEVLLAGGADPEVVNDEGVRGGDMTG